MASKKCFFPYNLQGEKSAKRCQEYVHMKLGECKIDLNSDTPFFDIFKCPKFKNILEEITFKLGNGINTDSLSKAVQLFIEREHPDLLDSNFRGIKFEELKKVIERCDEN